MGGTLPYIRIEEVLLESQQSSQDVGKYGTAFGFAMRGKPNFPMLVRKSLDFEKLFGVGSSQYDSKFHNAAQACLGTGPLVCMRISIDCESGGLVIMKAAAVGPNAALATGLADPLDYTFGADELLMFSGRFYGEDDNDLSVRITDVDGVAFTFVVSVYEGTTRVEQHTVTRKRGVYDGYGKSMYVADKINNNSAYIYAVDNTAEADTELPKAQATSLAMGAGDSGSEPSNAEIVTALDYMSDINTLNIYTFCDCGYSDATVQAKISAICVAAGFGLALLSIPADTDAADAITHKTTAAITDSFSAYFYPNTTVSDTVRDMSGIFMPSSVSMQKAFLNPNYDYFNVPLGESFLLPGTLETVLSADDAQTVLDAEINPIMGVTGVGNYAVTENTCVAQEGFSQRLSVRLLLNYIKWWLGRNFVGFRLNTRNTLSLWQRAEATLGSLLSYLQSRNAILPGAQAICNETNNDVNSDTLYATLIVSPTSIVKNIEVKVVVTPFGVDVSAAFV